jgi:hypothetical protein
MSYAIDSGRIECVVTDRRIKDRGG